MFGKTDCLIFWTAKLNFSQGTITELEFTDVSPAEDNTQATEHALDGLVIGESIFIGTAAKLSSAFVSR